MALHAVNPSGPVGRLKASGAKPELRWVEIASLRINDVYQRPVTARGQRTIAHIASHFSWLKFAPVIVRDRADGLYEIIDGQHRSMAALTVGAAQVPAMVVRCAADEAAAIFAAVNGDVTPMTPLAVYKAALAAEFPWAVAINRACRAAGVRAMTHAPTAKNQRAGEIVAIAALRRLLTEQNEATLTAVLKALAACEEARRPGFFKHGDIRRMASLFTGRPDWVAHIDGVVAALKDRSFLIMSDVELVRAVSRSVGDGRTSPEGWAAIVERVHDLKRRGFAPSMIASSLRLPYAEVERALRRPEVA